MPITFPPNRAASRRWIEEQARAARAQPPVPPEYDSTRGWPNGMDVPGGALLIARSAIAAGWTVEHTYSRGTWPGARTSRVVHCVAVRMGHRHTGLRAAALYRVPATGPAADQPSTGWELGGCLVRLPSGTITPYCSVRELGRIMVDPSLATEQWAVDLSRAERERVAGVKARAREARKTGTRKGSEDHD